jgi:hypothetical protein
MEDRVTVATRTAWNREPPIDNRVVEIYHNWTIVPAYHDGHVWRDRETEDIIALVAYWRPREAQR